MKLYEIRKNPDKNPKIDAWDAVQPYLHDEKYTFSFRENDEVSININADFQTPIGIYAWPGRLVQATRGNFPTRIPYAGDARYIFVLESVVKPLKASSYTDQQYLKDLAKLEEITGTDLQNWADMVGEHDAFYLLHDLLKEISLDKIPHAGPYSVWLKTWRNLYVKLGYKSVYDNLSIFIGDEEPMMVVYFTNDSYKVVDKIINKHYNTRIRPNR